MKVRGEQAFPQRNPNLEGGETMKRFKFLALVILGAVMGGVALTSWATPASANGGPHGGYTLSTSACGGCHRPHTGVAPNLLKVDSVYALCTSCHGGVVNTDVVHGELKGALKTNGTSHKPLNGGGFESVPGPSAAKLVTSTHSVEGLGGSTGIFKAWGSQNGDGVPAGDVGLGVEGTLECTSCHNPHGSSNYRILNDNGTGSSPAAKWVAGDVDLLPWVNSQVLATLADGPNYGFDTTNPVDCPPNPAVGAGTPTPYPGIGSFGAGTKCLARYTSGIAYDSVANKVTVPDFTKGMSAFCSTCHKSYLTQSGSAHRQNSLNTPVATVGAGTPTALPAYFYPGTQDSGDGAGNIARYRHAVEKRTTSAKKQPMRLAAVGSVATPMDVASTDYSALGCLTCHFAHGTGAQATPAAGLGLPDGPAADSALLFFDNRGVCVTCHLSPAQMDLTVPPTGP